MLLAIDIGNTATKFGLFDGDTRVETIVIPTKREVSGDEIAAMVGDRSSRVTDAIVSSVVPEANDAVRAYLSKLTGREPRFVRSTDDLGLSRSFSTETFGTDRLINAFAGAEMYGAPCIAISFGTATTIDAVSNDKQYLGGLIAPGPKAAAKALELITSKLPEVEIEEAANAINTTTESAIQAGIFYSQIGLVETAVRRIKIEIGDNARVVATGGYSSLIGKECALIDHIEPDLTLLGLKMLYSRA